MKSIFASQIYFNKFTPQTVLSSFDPDQNKLGFFVSVLPKHLLFGLYLFDTLSENLCFSLEFSGLHYCLFVKVQLVSSSLPIRTEKEGFEPSRRY